MQRSIEKNNEKRRIGRVILKKILIVEDDSIIASGLVYAFEQQGYAVTACGCVAEALLLGDSFDLAILDIQLPDGTGFDVRNKLPTKTAVIFLTVVDDEGNVVRAFESGADDYIVKPFRLRELIARVRRTLGLHEGSVNTQVISIGNVSIDTAAGKVHANNSLIELTALEYRLLLTFAQNKGLMLTRTQILESIWDSSGNFVEDNTLTVYIKRLREKLGDAVTIETLRGIGYRVD